MKERWSQSSSCFSFTKTCEYEFKEIQRTLTTTSEYYSPLLKQELGRGLVSSSKSSLFSWLQSYSNDTVRGESSHTKTPQGKRWGIQIVSWKCDGVTAVQLMHWLITFQSSSSIKSTEVEGNERIERKSCCWWRNIREESESCLIVIAIRHQGK